MGQAKKRGTFEERRAKALLTQGEFTNAVRQMPVNHPVKQVVAHRGHRRALLVAQMAGLLTPKIRV